MPRELSSQEIEIANGKVVTLAFFVEVFWPSGVARFWSGMGTLVDGGVSWTGVGSMGSISDIVESTSGRASGITLSLSGCDPAIVSAALYENYQYSKAAVYLGLCDSNFQLVAERREIFVGVVDVASDEDGPNGTTVTLSVEPLMIMAQQASGRRITHEARIAEYPGDLGYEYITAANREMVDNWGAPGASILQRSYGQSQTVTS